MSSDPQMVDRRVSRFEKIVPTIDPKLLALIVMSAVLWWLSGYFVTQKDYGKDQMEMKNVVQEIRADVKDLLKRK